MLFLSHQEPPPQPPAAAQIVQKSQEVAALGLRPHGSLVGPPKPLMSGAKIDFKKLAESFYVEVIVIEGQTEPLLKKPFNYMVTLPDGRIIWHRQQRNDLKYARMIPFWMGGYSSFTSYNFGFGVPLWNFPIGWGY